MRSNSFVWVIFSVLLVALTAGCGGGGEETPASEEPAASEPTPEPDAPAEPFEDEPPVDNPETSDLDVGYPVVEMRTTLGTIQIELYPDKAPKTVDNFLSYVRNGFYDGTIFHRVVPNFVIQGGGFTPDMTKKPTEAPIENEADNGLRNLRGTICMARLPDPHSATSQFFINTKDNPPLDFRGKTNQGWGYAVFGKVVDGLSVIDAIEKVPRTSKQGYQDVPVDAVVIETVRLIS